MAQVCACGTLRLLPGLRDWSLGQSSAPTAGQPDPWSRVCLFLAWGLASVTAFGGVAPNFVALKTRRVEHMAKDESCQRPRAGQPRHLGDPTLVRRHPLRSFVGNGTGSDESQLIQGWIHRPLPWVSGGFPEGWIPENIEWCLKFVGL